jgi:uncharacterized membrane protein
MAFCANCGSEVQGRFCAKCGTPVAAPAGPPPPGAQPGGSPSPGSQGYAPPPGGGYSSPAQAGLQENVASALCYVLGVLTGVLFLVIEPYSRNRNIRFHAFQAIFAWIAVVALSIIIAIVSPVFSFMPFIGWMISVLLWAGFSCGVFVLWLMLMYKAYNNEKWVLPVVGPMAEKQA